MIDVPPGTLVIDARPDHVLKDLAAARRLASWRPAAATGAKATSASKAPPIALRANPRPAAKPSRALLTLELKVIADVGLIGKPNAGKSTLLSRLSRARPEIADYPFTTKYPNLGIVQVSADRSFVLADIPGLIEGAHAGAGLGHEFLRHIERAGILVHLVEPLPADGSDPLANYRVVRGELEQYDVELGRRPEIVAVTKAELPGAAEVRDRLAAELNEQVLAISAVTGQGLDQLLRVIVRVLDETSQR